MCSRPNRPSRVTSCTAAQLVKAVRATSSSTAARMLLGPNMARAWKRVRFRHTVCDLGADAALIAPTTTTPHTWHYCVPQAIALAAESTRPPAASDSDSLLVCVVTSVQSAILAMQHVFDVVCLSRCADVQ